MRAGQDGRLGQLSKNEKKLPKVRKLTFKVGTQLRKLTSKVEFQLSKLTSKVESDLTS